MNAARRRFLIWTGALGAALVVGTFYGLPGVRENAGSWARRLAGARRTPQSKLLTYFHYLKIPGNVADSYVADYRAHVHDIGRLSLLDEDFYTRFLLSTDFFQNGAEETRALAYVSIYGPTITLCYNPLARLD